MKNMVLLDVFHLNHSIHIENNSNNNNNNNNNNSSHVNIHAKLIVTIINFQVE